MKCPACAAELASGAVFCHLCGAKTNDPTAVQPAVTPPPVGDMASPRTGLGGARRDDPEVELWQGGYSTKAMLNSFIGMGLLSIALIAGGIFFPVALLPCLGVLALLWVFMFAVLLYRRMNISYRLTSQRFFHQTGILTRTTNRIEVIEMDDVTFSQNLFERLVGVGTIKITSSDSTDPVLVMTGIDNVQEVSEIIDKARRKELTRRGLRIESV
ncbi:MAG TPA: PH domain-containing protein [Pirellulaceae bacterium]|nr:PH domain-containing protein [Pirellulaceae bacterium]